MSTNRSAPRCFHPRDAAHQPAVRHEGTEGRRKPWRGAGQQTPTHSRGSWALCLPSKVVFHLIALQRDAIIINKKIALSCQRLKGWSHVLGGEGLAGTCWPRGASILGLGVINNPPNKRNGFI